jgi:IS5 family transposase
LWESLLPAEALVMPAELARVDRLLDDERFFAPFVPFFHATQGRPSIPIEVYLRLMFLKYRYRLGFEAVCRETTDSITWQRFCRIALGGRVPHPTTLMKITTRCGVGAIEQLNEALLAKATEAKVLKTNRLRADTTVIEANVAYPSDSALLAKGVARIARSVGRLKAAGLATRTRFTNKTRSIQKRARSINANLRRRSDDKLAEVRRINAEMAVIARATVRQAERVVANARRKLAATKQPSGRARAEVNRLERLAERTTKIVEQLRQRLAGRTPPGATRVVSLHDPDARPIVKQRLGRPVEFGYKAQIVDNEDGIIVDHNVEVGNPPDAPQLAPAIARVKHLTGRAPRAVTADRGYGDPGVEDDLRQLGVRYPAIPTKGKPSAARRQTEHRRAFKRMVRWRTGSEGRISHVKRDFGLNRTRYTGIEGARTWCGHGVFNYNLTKIATLLDTAA